MKANFKGMIKVTKISAKAVDILRRSGYLVVLVQEVNYDIINYDRADVTSSGMLGRSVDSSIGNLPCPCGSCRC